jgi:hypothetical protein
MTIPPATYGKTTPGLAPGNSYEVNSSIGTHLRQFTDLKETIGHDYESLLGTDLKAEPFNMSADDETLIKSAVSDLHTALQAIDTTFINRLTGLW